MCICDDLSPTGRASARVQCGRSANIPRGLGGAPCQLRGSMTRGKARRDPPCNIAERAI